MKAAKSVYEGINNELKDELPGLFDRWHDIICISIIHMCESVCIFKNKFYIMFFSFSRIGCYISVFSAVSNLREIFYKEMSVVRMFAPEHRVTYWYKIRCFFFNSCSSSVFQLNGDLLNVLKELQAQHPDKVFEVRTLQRWGFLTNFSTSRYNLLTYGQ